MPKIGKRFILAFVAMIGLSSTFICYGFYQPTGSHRFYCTKSKLVVTFDAPNVSIKDLKTQNLKPKSVRGPDKFREIMWRDFENNRCYHRTRIVERAHSKTYGGLFFTTAYNIDGIKSEERIRTGAGKISNLEQDLTKLRKFHSGKNGRVFLERLKGQKTFDIFVKDIDGSFYYAYLNKSNKVGMSYRLTDNGAVSMHSTKGKMDTFLFPKSVQHYLSDREKEEKANRRNSLKKRRLRANNQKLINTLRKKALVFEDALRYETETSYAG